jgi:hypothetical protein
LERLKAFAEGPFRQLVTPEGFIFTQAGNDVVIADRAGTPLGKATNQALQELGGQAGAAASAAEGFLSLTGAARSWLSQHNLLNLARQFLTADVENIKEIVESINQFHRCQNFEQVVGNYLRGLAGSGDWSERSKQGASFVLRYANSELKGIDPFTIVFESPELAGGRIPRRSARGPLLRSRPIRGAFTRRTDIRVLNKKIELKSVPNLSEDLVQGYVRQLGRDIKANADDLNRLKWVFDAERLEEAGVAQRTIIDTIKTAIKRDEVLFRTRPWNDLIDKALEEIIDFWPKKK